MMYRSLRFNIAYTPSACEETLCRIFNICFNKKNFGASLLLLFITQLFSPAPQHFLLKCYDKRKEGLQQP